MATFQYKARDKFGKPIKGLMSADSEGAIAQKLTTMEYVPIAIREIKEPPATGRLFGAFRRVGFIDLNMFTRQLSSLQKAGVPLISGLNAIREQTTNAALRDIVGQMVRDIEAGASLSAALKNHPHTFSPLYVNMIKSGETGGTLEQSLERLVTLGEHEEKVRLRIRAATRYPVIVVAAITIGFLILTTMVVPRFAQIYDQFTVALPLPTRILLLINFIVTKFFAALFLIISASVVIFRKVTHREKGRYWWDTLKLKMPVFGPLLLKLIMSRFARITGTLIRSGVPILQVLDLASGGAGNAVVARTIDDIKKSVNEGKGMSKPMQSTRMFTPIVVQMVAIGEETGKLDELLLHVSDYYDLEIEYTLNNLTALIEPLLILILGIIVLFMALGIFLPIWNLMNVLK
ncbi:MAG: type II secretion system F family protein [Candidatus Omnitrophota bacterium]